MRRPYAVNEKIIMHKKRLFNNRQSNRLQGYDYATPGAYFVTIVSFKRAPLFGKIIIDKVQLSRVGKVVEDCWQEIPFHFPRVMLQDFVVMPNHLHGIIEIKDYPNGVSKGIFVPQKISQKPVTKGPQPHSLSAIIGAFKSATTKHIHRLGLIDQKIIWQRNFYDHIIRDDEDHQQIDKYIQHNPINWQNDQENILH